MRQVFRLIGLTLGLAALAFSGCANRDFVKDYQVTRPAEEMWCSSGASSPFPPYCHPDRW